MLYVQAVLAANRIICVGFQTVEFPVRLESARLGKFSAETKGDTCFQRAAQWGRLGGAYPDTHVVSAASHSAMERGAAAGDFPGEHQQLRGNRSGG
jgi:hypothetical protein